jgi:hypothetical protein
MVDEDPNLDLPEVDDTEDEKGFPWIGVLIAVVVFAAAAFWIIRGKNYKSGQATSVAALEQQLASDKATLDTEKEKVFEMTKQLDGMKQAIRYGQVPDKKKATEEYNALAKAQVEQRDKVKALADQYNVKIEQLQKLQ